MEIQKKLVLEILNDWGFRATEIDDTHIEFRYQLNNVVCLLDALDEAFYTIGLGNFWEFTEEDESEILKICNKINKGKKQVKVYTLHGQRIVASAEFYCYTKEDLPKYLKRALESVVSAKFEFLQLLM